MQPPPPALVDVWDPDRLMPLGPGRPNEAVRQRLQALTPEILFGPAGVKRLDAAQACLAGLWLRYDFLDQSHGISQDLAGEEGAYWHAFMHRREPDYWNSKYWFRRVGKHAVFEPLAAAARNLAQEAPPPARFLDDSRSWDPLAFVDLCEKAANQGGALEDLCRRVQQAEWDLLYGYCRRQALGDD